MTKSLLIAALTMVSASAFAGEVKLTVRSDYMNVMKSKNTSDKDMDGKTVFVPNFARLTMNGKVGAAEVRSALNLRNSETITGGDKSSGDWPMYSVVTPASLVEYLYVSKNFGDWNFTAGKIETMLGGFEGSQDNSGLNYMGTLATGFMGANHPLSGASVVGTPGNGSGVGMAYKMDKHLFTFQAFNQSSSDSTYNAGAITSANYKRHNLGVNYLGDFGTFQFNFAYYVGYTGTSSYASASGTTGGSESDETYMNLGVKGTSGDLTYTAEYFDNTSKATTASAKKNQTNTIYGQVEYKSGIYSPLLRVETSYHKQSEDDSVAGSFKRTGLVGGVAIRPTDDPFQYHVMYTSASDNHGLSSLANTKVNYQALIVGIKYDGDLLK